MGFVLAVLSAVPAPILAADAQGKLTFSLQYRGGFMLSQLQETEAGFIEGASQWGVNQDWVSARLTPSELILHAKGRDSTLAVTHATNLDVYRGIIDGAHMTEINAYRDPKKSRLRINGRIGDANFAYEGNFAKREFYLMWDGLDITVKGVNNSPGECKGIFTSNAMEIGKFFCESAGSLDDALFKRAEAVIAFLIYPLVEPQEIRGDKENDNRSSP